jgi:RHS repeat-associated protein
MQERARGPQCRPARREPPATQRSRRKQPLAKCNSKTSTIWANCKRDGRTVTYSYNQLGDQTGQSLLNADGEAIEITTFTYNSDGEMTGADNPSATETFTYDNGGNLKTEATSGPGTGQPTVTLTYSYYPSGQLESISDSLSGSGDAGQGITTYVYNDAQELTTITQSIGGTAGPEVTMTYDPAGLVSDATSSIDGSGSDFITTYSYDPAEDLTAIATGSSTESGGSPEPLGRTGPMPTTSADSDATYNSAGQVTGTSSSFDGSSASNSYTYDNDNQLTSASGATDDSYSYDANGNRNSTGYTTGTGNELINSPGVTYTYDNDGNMLTATTSSGTTTYTYDYQNQLTNVEINGTVVATYTYDALGQRIGIKDNGTQTWTVYNGNSADANPYADFNSSGGLQTRYLDGPAVDQVLAGTNTSGNTSWYFTNQIGSVIAIASTTAGTEDEITYDPFGNIVTQTNATDDVRFGFAGMEFDSVTGLYYDHARYYDAAIGRFTTQDPKGFSAGDTNLYRYVGNDPTFARDPSGYWLPLVGAGLGALYGLVSQTTTQAIYWWNGDGFDGWAVARSTVVWAAVGGLFPVYIGAGTVTGIGTGAIFVGQSIGWGTVGALGGYTFRGALDPPRSSPTGSGAYTSSGGYTNPGYAGGY